MDKNINIFKLIENKDINSIQTLINNGIDININRRDGITPLIFASYSGHKDIVKLLVNNGANVNSLSKTGFTALIASCQQGYLDISDFLLLNNADINIESKNNQTALIKAIVNNHINIVELFFTKSNIDINKKYKADMTILHLAIMSRNIKIVKLLLKFGANINQVNKEQCTPLMIGALSGNKEIVMLLFENGANINDVDIVGRTALMYATSININNNNFKEEIKRYPIEIEYKESLSTMSDFMQKLICPNTEIVEFLIKNGSDVNIKDKFSFTALILAKENNNKTAMILLKKAGADIDTDITEENVKLSLKFLRKKVEKNTEIFNILEMKDTELLKKALKKGIDITNIPFVDIVKQEYPFEFIRIILEKGNISREEKDVAFNIAFQNENENLIELLLSSDKKIENNSQNLVKILTNFTIDTPIKYTTHEWRARVEKKYINNFDLFIGDITKLFKDIEEELKNISPKLHTKIYNFLISKEPSTESWCSKGNIFIGWSSLNGLKAWVDAGNEPFDFQLESSILIENSTITTFGEVIELFKNEIEIRNDMLQEIFTTHKKKLGRKFKINISDNLQKEKFYTDVESFTQSINEIFQEIKKYAELNDNYSVDIELSKPNTKYIELYITHNNSLSARTGEDLLERMTSKGDSVELYKLLKNLCDWNIEAESKEGSFKIDCFSKNCISLEDTPKGYTHIMRFYK